MARFKRRARRAFSRVKKSYRRANKGAGINLMTLATVGIYGALRPKVVSTMSPISSKIPAGQYSENVTIGLAAWGIGKFMPKAKGITNAVLMVEAAKVGEKLGAQYMGGSSTTSSNYTAYG